MAQTSLSNLAVVEAEPSVAAIPNYRQQIRRALPASVFQPDLTNLLWYPVHFAIIGASWYLLMNHFAWWVAPILAVVIGHSLGCMGFLAHDIAHGGAIKNLILRDVLSGIGFSPYWISPRLWRRWHNADHHGHTQIEGVDPDHLFTIEDYKSNPILRMLYRMSPVLRNIVIAASFTFRMTQQQLRMVFVYVKSSKTGPWEKAVIISQTAFALALWIGVPLAIGGSHLLIWGYLVPLLVANAMVISYIATNHFLNPLADENDILGTSLTVTLPKGLRWLDPWHQYFGAHVAHHLFPQAPARSTRLIEEKTRELFPDRYHSMSIFRALKLLLSTPWVYEDHKTLVDPVRQERSPTLGNGLK